MGCTSPAVPPPPPPPAPVPPPVPSTSRADLPPQFDKVFTGTIGEKEATLYLNRSGEDLGGAYVFEEPRPLLHGRKNAFLLEGKLQADGQFSLGIQQLEQPGGTLTGKLRVETQPQGRQLVLEGDWSGQGQSAPTKIKFVEELQALGNGVELTEQVRNDENQPANYVFQARYPQLSGATDEISRQFNQKVELLVDEAYHSFKAEVAKKYSQPQPPPTDATGTNQLNSMGILYEVFLASSDLISIRLTIDINYVNTPPILKDLAVNYDRRTGKMLQFADLFAPNSSFLPKLSTLCKSLATGSGYTFPDISAKPENFSSWNVNRRGVLINFQVPFAEGGSVEAAIPYRELKDVLNPTGPLSSLVKP